MTEANELADLKPGDTVVLIRAGRYGRDPKPERVIVTRLTETQIVIGYRRFRKADGRQVERPSSWSGYSRVVTAARGEHEIAEWEECHAFDHAKLEFESCRPDFTRDGIARMRAACDVAEAVLRKVGRWA